MLRTFGPNGTMTGAQLPSVLLYPHPTVKNTFINRGPLTDAERTSPTQTFDTKLPAAHKYPGMGAYQPMPGYEGTGADWGLSVFTDVMGFLGETKWRNAYRNKLIEFIKAPSPQLHGQATVMRAEIFEDGSSRKPDVIAAASDAVNNDVQQLKSSPDTPLAFDALL
eukprot:TRINITY_DN29024_c0_g1_i1.p1 TRINITY_DN29024_c0_g1~~TRINITY_DN29024_c0_g1_i1.p1  ORF type:complete len:166 (-),score=25.79 TRINITY_DN29024_c0_g1_i1:151-648(-)